MTHLFSLTCFCFTFFLGLSVFAQENDFYIGTFTSEESGLSVSSAKTADGYAGYLSVGGEKYPFKAVKLLGMLSGTYPYQGAEATFSLARIMGVYYVTGDGVSIVVNRVSEKPASAPAAVAAPKPVATPATKPAASPATVSSGGGSVAPATGTAYHDPFGAYHFKSVTGWSCGVEGSSHVLSKSGTTVKLAVGAHGYNSVAEVRNDVVDVNDRNNQLYLKATTQAFGSNGLLIRFTGTSQGQPIVLETITLISPFGGGVNVVGSGAGSAYNQSHTSAVKALAASVTFSKPPVSAAAESWKQKIAGKELLYLNTANGGSSKTSIHLCRNGAFSYHSDESYMSGGSSTFSYASQDNDQGVWRVSSKGSQVVLLLNYRNGSVGEYALTTRQAGNEIGLNGKRYFLQASNQCQ